MEEQWKCIEGYENYQISNRGQVKSLWFRKEKILKSNKTRCGYLQVHLSKNKKIRAFTIHTLVWDAFGSSPRNGRIFQVDHINNDKTDNCIENLQLLSPSDNCSKRSLQKEKTSKYTGVCWHKKAYKWHAQIMINNKHYNIGYFNTEEKAKNAYQYILTHQDEIINRPIKEKTSQYRGVSWHKRDNIWQSAITVNSKRYHLGYFNTQEEAAEAYLKAKENLK